MKPSKKTARSGERKSPITKANSLRTDDVRTKVKVRDFPIVGVGASAGGLEAFTQFLKGLPARPGIALVLIQHLDPNHESMTAEILSRATQMPVTEVTNGMRVESNQVYVIPPNYAMSISNRVLSLVPRVESRGPYMTVDYFFQSLAEDQGNKAVGVVLSGTATDGTEGVRAIKAAGGITFAEDPKVAKFDGMPRSAIISASIDFILTADKIGEELVRIATHPYVILPLQQELKDGVEESVDLTGDARQNLARVFKLLRQKTKVEFGEYKHATLQRRIERRMVVQRKGTLRDYLDYLEEYPAEVDALYADILIHVTRFFRDPEAFKALKSRGFPALMKNHPPETPFRVWVPGCSTGEEVYSLAISLVEFLVDSRLHTPIQIFATDISEQALKKARAGIYPEIITRDISPARLKRFFVKVDEGYKIGKQIRDLCVFSRHDVTGDPPFARLDFISCRNLLIYFSATLQRRVLPIFHYAIKPGGLLWLGRSESILGYSDLFSSFDKANKIYTRKPGRLDSKFRYPIGISASPEKELTKPSARPSEAGFDLQKEADRAILTKNASPGVVVNERMEILQFRGRIAPYLEPVAGQATHQLFKMARPTIVSELRMLVQSVKKTNALVSKEGLEVTDEIGRVWTFTLKVIPIHAPPPQGDRFFLILFEQTKIQEKAKRGVPGSKRQTKLKSFVEKRNTQLERELTENKKFQESLALDYESAHEELAATNEEFQSTNEELQSANEELETAKEELQSTNEELTTVNEELQNRNTEVGQVNNDLINLLSSVEIPILMIGSEGRIRRFTPVAGKILKLLSSDIGRPISDIKSNFNSIGIELDLAGMVLSVIEKEDPLETEIQDRNGRWYRLQIKPYRTLEEATDGAVIAFIDIDILKQGLKEVKAARSEAEKANRTKDLFLATLSHELRTPLTTILSWAQMLRMGRLDEKKTMRAAEMIEESVNTQAQLINDLLDVSRIVLGKLPLELKEVDPGTTIRAAIEAVRTLADAKGIRIEVNFDTGIGTVLADQLRLQQVFTNLLVNSIKFSHRDSKVSVNLQRGAETLDQTARIRVQVVDSGKGISPEFLPHIFDRFTQADSSATRTFGGLGLGLAIVRNLLELHGGKIEAESLGLGKGATFTVYLPLLSAKKSSDTQRREKAFEMRQLQMGKVRLDGIKILLVDDEPGAREVFTEMLRSYGAEVETVASVPKALTAFNTFRPHVLLSDLAMPDEDGYSLIKKIRALSPEDGGTVPAVALTAHAGTEDIRHTLSSGFQSHVGKPVDADYLASVVASVARKKISKASE
jgi:two-component system, chemotaxis family, CheB/CheR fusion protein